MDKIKGYVDGKEKEFEVVLIHKSEKFNKEYIVYTDNTKDENGKTKIYVSAKTSSDFLQNDLTGEELNEIKNVLDNIK